MQPFPICTCGGHSKRLYTEIFCLLPLVFPLPATDRILQTGQTCGLWFLLTFIFDKAPHYVPVTAYLAEQVIEQDSFLHRTCEQVLGRMPFPAQLPHDGLNRKRKPALRAKPGPFLWFGVYWVDEIDTAIGTLQ